MKAFAKDKSWLPVWLFASIWCIFNFTISDAVKPSNQPAQGNAREYSLASSLHKEFPVALPSVDTPQIFAQNRKAEDKGNSPFKYCSKGNGFRFSAITACISHRFVFLHTHFFKYLFILYCVLLI